MGKQQKSYYCITLEVSKKLELQKKVENECSLVVDIM